MTSRDDAPIAGFADFDAMDPTLRRRHQEILEAKLGPNWPLGRTGRPLAVGAIGLAGFLAAGSLSLTEPATTPAPTRALLGMLALFSLGWTVFALRGLARRTGDFASERVLASQIAVGFALAALVGLALTAGVLQKGPAAQPMLITALGFVVVAATGSVQARIDQAELSQREQSLRVEAMLASLRGRPPVD